MKGILERRWSRKQLCDAVGTAKGLTYLGERVKTGGGREAAVSARTEYGWPRSWGCVELLYV